MEFGIFSQMHCPPWDDEHSRYMRELEVSELCDAVGFKYDWSPEHHFLQHYSHQPAPEVYLSWVAARTKRIHIGTAITNITAAVNHPARVAERIATMDHLSEGRVEFGTGRGSSSAEWAGFDIPSAAETKPMWRESLEQIPRMWRDEPYAFQGKYFRMPERTVLPKPYSKPHPPMWVACSSPQTFAEAGELGLGALCFTFGTPADIAAHVKNYKDAVKRCTKPVGAYVNDNIAVTTNMFCFDDGEEARHLYAKAKVGAFTGYFFKWLDSIPRPKGLPPTGPIPPLPDPTPADLKAGLAVGGRQIGSPDEIAKVIEMYVELGVDQLIYAPLTLTLDQKHVLRSIETFGRHVLPRFDRDPVHSTTRQREAARAAHAAFEDGPWPRMSAAERGACLREAAVRFREAAPGLVDLTIAETGSVRPVAESQQVGAVPVRLSKYAELAIQPADTPVGPREGPGGIAFGVAAREPVGVVACITPSNFPMTNCAGKIAPALACGNTVVVKPAPVDPLGVAALCRIVDQVLPPGVLNFVCGSSPATGEALVDSPDVAMISFTGSTAVGLRIQETAARRLKRTLLELGGKSPQIVFADADRDAALRGAAQVWTFHSGQICIAGTRLLVEASIYDEFTAALAERAKTIRIGDPRQPGVVMGPLVSSAQRDRVEQHVVRGVEEGAVLACGGRRPPHLPRGWFVEPTLFTQATNTMAVAREEIFGPVITAIPFRDEAEAIALANDSDYGLYAYVWTRDRARGTRVARALRTGTVQVNSASGMHPDAPFGGYKRSGIGRDGGAWALAAYSETKYIGWTA